MSTRPDHEPHPTHTTAVEALSTLRDRLARALGIDGTPTWDQIITRAASAQPTHEDCAGCGTGTTETHGDHAPPANPDAKEAWRRERDRAEAAEAKIAELTADCDELIAKNRTVIQQGAAALARAAAAEAQVQRVRNAIASATWPSAMVRAQTIRDAIEHPKEPR